MNGVVCVDASVAVKWLLEEQNSDLAEALLSEARSSATALHTPPQFDAEVTSALTQRVWLQELSLQEALEALRHFANIDVVSVLSSDLRERALELAAEFNWQYPYDAYYLAVGELLDCDVWTADGRFFRATRGRYPRVRLLSEYAAR